MTTTLPGATHDYHTTLQGKGRQQFATVPLGPDCPGHLPGWRRYTERPCCTSSTSPGRKWEITTTRRVALIERLPTLKLVDLV